jgi:hypothetical protein
MRDLVGHDHLPSAFLVYLFFPRSSDYGRGEHEVRQTSDASRDHQRERACGPNRPSQERRADCAESAAPKGPHSGG